MKYDMTHILKTLVNPSFHNIYYWNPDYVKSEKPAGETRNVGFGTICLKYFS